MQTSEQERLISQLKGDNIYVFHKCRFNIINISEINNPSVKATLPLDNYQVDYRSGSDCMLVDDNYCYILAQVRTPTMSETMFESCPSANIEPNALAIIDTTNPSQPLLVSDVRIPFTRFDKNNFRSPIASERCNELGFSSINLRKYNEFILVEGYICEYGCPCTHTRVYVIDVSVPTIPRLLGYINFPYIINDMVCEDNYLYISTEDSILYKYDSAKIFPNHLVSDSPEPEEDQSGQVEENTPEGEPASQEPEGDAEEPAIPEDTSQEEITDDGENYEEQKKIKSIYQSYWPLLSLIPSQPMTYSCWPWLSYLIPDNVLTSSHNSLPSSENTLLYGESTLPYSNTSLPYYIPGKPSPGYYPLLLPRSESSLKNSWYLPALPFSYVDYLLSPDFGLNINLPADYPGELLPDLLYLFGIKVEHPSD